MLLGIIFNHSTIIERQGSKVFMGIIFNHMAAIERQIATLIMGHIFFRKTVTFWPNTSRHMAMAGTFWTSAFYRMKATYMPSTLLVAGQRAPLRESTWFDGQPRARTQPTG
jgi:hypothetical protein